jgi:RNA polymerase sigma-70 factor (ECF subfamily)
MYAEQYPRVRAYLRRRLFASSEADDVAAEVFRIAWQQSLSDGVPHPGWVMVTARNALANHLRAQDRRGDLAGRLASEFTRSAMPGAAPQSSEPGASSGVEAASDATLAALDAIGQAHREVLALHYWDQLSGAECAAVLGCSIRAFYVRLHRARNAFRAQYTKGPKQ